MATLQNDHMIGSSLTLLACAKCAQIKVASTASMRLLSLCNHPPTTITLPIVATLVCEKCQLTIATTTSGMALSILDVGDNSRGHGINDNPARSLLSFLEKLLAHLLANVLGCFRCTSSQASTTCCDGNSHVPGCLLNCFGDAILQIITLPR